MRIPFNVERAATRILENLNYIIKTYGKATVAELYDLGHVGYQYHHTRQGWTDLHDAKIIYNDFEKVWYLILPEPKELYFKEGER